MNPTGKLLIVDDEIEIIELLTNVLKASVKEIHTAKNGQEALEKLKTEHFDAVLSDINMPKMDGLNLLKQIRNEGIQIPFVILTAHGDKKLAIEALKLLAYDFLEKPWEDEELITSINRAIRLGRQFECWNVDPEFSDLLKEVRDDNAREAIYRLKYIIDKK